MPVVDIKGVGKAQFPDDMPIEDIRAFLRNKYSQRAMQGKSDLLAPAPQTASPYEPTLTDRLGSGIAEGLKGAGLISDNYGAQQIGKNVTALGEFLPGIGDAAAGDEFGRAVAEGDNLGMGLAALGAIPVVGDAAKKFKGKVYHQTDSDFEDFDFNKTSDGTVWFTDNKANFSDPSSSAGAAAGTGRVIEKEVELNKVAGYDELDKFSIGELRQQGYDGAVLDGDIQVFDPKAISQSLPMDEASRIKGYRGISAANKRIDPNITWFSADEKLAKGYSDKNKAFSKDLNIKAPFDAGDDKNTTTPRKLVNKALNQIAKQKGVKNIDRKEALLIRDDFLTNFPNPDKSVDVLDFWSSDDAKDTMANMLEDLGFDAIRLKEEGVETYGVIRMGGN